MALINCPECNKEISDKVIQCPHCGYPIKEIEPNNKPQPVEVMAVNIKPNNPAKIKRILLITTAVICIAAIVIGALHFQEVEKKKKVRQEYLSNLNLVTATMYIGGSEAESLCNLTAKVWRNTIYKERDNETDKYRSTGYGSSFLTDDFNVALANLFKDSETKKKVESIESNQLLVETLMKSLNNPTEEFSKCYDTLQELYSSYQGLTDLAINPSGSLQSFGDSKSSKVDKFIEYYKKLENQIPETDVK